MKRYESRKSDGSDWSRLGFSMIELIVVMAIVGLLAAISIPAITQAREAARKAKCLSNLRNITFGLTQYDHFNGRLPAAGYYFDPPDGQFGEHHSWAVSILSHIDQENLLKLWDLDKPITDPANVPLTQAHIPIYVCPMDLTRNKEKKGDLSYVVNGGFGFTTRTPAGVGDCPIDRQGRLLDLNGDGQACTGNDLIDDEDRRRFKQTGLFFVENWKSGGTTRHHSLADIHDGTSQTFLVTENVRTGYDPDVTIANFAAPDPLRSSFFIGNPCRDASCSIGNVDYSLCNAGQNRINSGLWSPEGHSPVPNSFHPGGVNMAYADGHVKFISEQMNGEVYAALASPQGLLLNGIPLQQVTVSGGDF
ncbi:DUF1559 domain-containing protein [Planctomicrobium sp.]|nr:DUF1559 domain-containing protein [Planctomicrobium sp.]MDA7528172.1 DUF1559 domain-containing protein [bacterium]MDB4732989.1 DUF1559 domain-containing protein [Planctomicrobium sp.]